VLNRKELKRLDALYKNNFVFNQDDVIVGRKKEKELSDIIQLYKDMIICRDSTNSIAGAGSRDETARGSMNHKLYCIAEYIKGQGQDGKDLFVNGELRDPTDPLSQAGLRTPGLWAAGRGASPS